MKEQKINVTFTIGWADDVEDAYIQPVAFASGLIGGVIKDTYFDQVPHSWYIKDVYAIGFDYVEALDDMGRMAGNLQGTVDKLKAENEALKKALAEAGVYPAE